MLTQLQTVKSRLAIAAPDTQYDALLTSAIAAVSARFDLETNRTLARTVDATYEFGGEEVHLVVPSYPIETVTRFELKFSEAELWQEQPTPDFLIRHKCVISLAAPLASWRAQARVSYTGGFVLPGTVPAVGQTALPPDLEQAATEQVAFWFQTRSTTGANRIWPSGGNYTQYADIDLIPSVRSVLHRHMRLLL